MNPPNIAYTLRHDLCLGCGVCQSTCPSSAISIVVQQGRFIPQINETKCKHNKGCHRCHDVCPGLGVNLQQIAEEKFADTKTDELVGHYLKCFTGYSNDQDVRYHCASGGMVSQFLIFLLKKKYIDGAVVTAFDPGNELLVRTYIAHDRKEVLRAKSSKYAPVSMHGIAQAIKQETGNRYVIVGLPCHIQGFRKLEALDRKFREKVIGYFGIYCSSGRTFYLTEHVFREHRIKQKELTYFAYRDEGCLGCMIIKGTKTNTLKPFLVKERYQSYYHPLRSFFIPRRCLFCIDHYAELADISFGDIHIEPFLHDKIGINSLIVRKQIWLNWLMEAKKERYIELNELDIKVLKSSQEMAYKKKGRNARFILLNKKFGRIVPKYDEPLPEHIGIKTMLDYIQNRFQQFIGRHKSLWWLVSLFKKDTSKLK